MTIVSMVCVASMGLIAACGSTPSTSSGPSGPSQDSAESSPSTKAPPRVAGKAETPQGPNYYFRLFIPKTRTDLETVVEVQGERAGLAKAPRTLNVSHGGVAWKIVLSDAAGPRGKRVQAAFTRGDEARASDWTRFPEPTGGRPECGVGRGSSTPFWSVFALSPDQRPAGSHCAAMLKLALSDFTPTPSVPAPLLRGATGEVAALIRELIQGRSVVHRQNAALSLAKLGPKAAAATPALIKALDEAGYVRKAAAQALAAIGPAAGAAQARLAAVLKGETDPFVQSELKAALKAVAKP